jgi:hypothetical protein
MPIIPELRSLRQEGQPGLHSETFSQKRKKGKKKKERNAH